MAEADWMQTAQLVLPVATGLGGTVLGFAVTRWNETLNESRELRRAVGHILSETMNARRHYQLSLVENQKIVELPRWRRVVQLGKCRFYGNGLGSFEISALRLFAPEIGEEILDFMLVIRNTDFYIDQAIDHAGSGEEETFNTLVEALFERFHMAVAESQKVEASIRSHYKVAAK